MAPIAQLQSPRPADTRRLWGASLIVRSAMISPKEVRQKNMV
jgi:hypothetical protein